MAIYDNAVVIQFPEGDQGLFTNFSIPYDSSQMALYTTKQGDTLFSIAIYVYGDTSRWIEIAEKNFIVIPNPFEIPEGIILEIPQ